LLHIIIIMIHPEKLETLSEASRKFENKILNM